MCQAIPKRIGINKLNWPACSSDLNPIEQVWDMLGRRIRSTITKFHFALEEEWQNIPQDGIYSLINSMNGRLQAVIAASEEKKKILGFTVFTLIFFYCS